MISYIKGTLEEAAIDSIIIENNGIGYDIKTPTMIDRPALRKVLDIPEGKEVPVILALGYPADPAVLPKKRREEADLFRFGSYSAGEGR